MRILVVDDSRTMRKILRKSLESFGDSPVEILEASDGAEALSLLCNEKLEVDLVFLDWNMPALDGISFLKKLKALMLSPEVAVIMVTSQAQREHVAEAIRWGARDYIVKPFGEEVLREKYARIRAQIEQRKCAETSVMLHAIAGAASADLEASFLSQLPPEVVAELRGRSGGLSHPAGSLILRPGQPVDLLQVIVSGEVEVEGPGVPEIRKAGDCFGEMAFISGE